MVRTASIQQQCEEVTDRQTEVLFSRIFVNYKHDFLEQIILGFLHVPN